MSKQHCSRVTPAGYFFLSSVLSNIYLLKTIKQQSLIHVSSDSLTLSYTLGNLAYICL